MELDRIITGDCTKVMARWPAGSVDLLFADPPFNIGYRYDVYRDRKKRGDYLAFADAWLATAVRALAPHGSLWVAIGDEFAAEYRVRLDALGLHRRNWCVWYYTFGPHQTTRFGRDHAHLFYYSRDPQRFTWNPDSVRIESARQRLGDKRANPKGRVPGDVWEFARLPGNARERTGHPCQMPESVLTRIIRATSNAGDVVADPFAGSGTTLAVAKKLSRRYLGVELSARYARAVEKRLDAVEVES